MNKRLIHGIVGLVCGGFILVSISLAVQSDKATYVGPNTCKRCHNAKYTEWQENMSVHVNALKKLPADKQTDANCIVCHVTGAGRETGYKDEKTTPDLAGVTCEACHGPGSEHVAARGAQRRDAITRVPTTCTKCHNTHVSYKKQYEKK